MWTVRLMGEQRIRYETARVGDTVRLTLPHTDPCRHLRVAGEIRRVHVLLRGVLILDDDGTPLSDPVPHAQAGLHRRADDPSGTAFHYIPAP